jgi:protein-tyrosine phosphatase
MTSKLLVLCTGNYYRSRFAEMLFNKLAAERGLDWQADSCGFAVEGQTDNVGPMSRYAIDGLAARGIDPGSTLRSPRQLRAEDLQQANLIVAVKEVEHRPYLQAQFPDWLDRVEFWHVHDLDKAPASEALDELESRVRTLVERLAEAAS